MTTAKKTNNNVKKFDVITIPYYDKYGECIFKERFVKIPDFSDNYAILKNIHFSEKIVPFITPTCYAKLVNFLKENYAEVFCDFSPTAAVLVRSISKDGTYNITPYGSTFILLTASYRTDS